MRLDRATPVRDLDELRRFLPQIMPSRVDSVLYFAWPVEADAILAALEAHNAHADEPIRLFHVVLAACVRTLAERPQLNRFVLGGRLFERPGISLTFSVKKGKRDDARIVSTKVEFAPTDSLEDVRRKVDAAIAASRDPEAVTSSEREVALLNRLPRPLTRRLLGGVRRLERWGLLPHAVLADDPMHTSAFVANLGSIGLDASFHHLSDAGTASIHVTVGRVKPGVVVGEDRQVRVADVLDLKVAIDDRICDGFYCARSLLRLGHWLTHPRALLERSPARPDLIVGRLWAHADRTPERPAYHLRGSDGRWYATTWMTFREEVRAAARALLGAGVARGDRVAIQGSNRPEWVTMHLAAMAIGAVPCGLHEDLSPAELQALLALARPTVVLLETDAGARFVHERLPEVRIVLMARRRVGEAAPARTDTPGVAWDDWLDDGRAADDGAVERAISSTTASDPAVVVFTSGTTGEPRGVVLTHANLAWTADRVAEVLETRAEDTSLSYLPLSHVAEQNVTIYGAITAGASVAYVASRGAVFDALKEVRPTVFFGVPQVWSRLHREIAKAPGPGWRARVGLDRTRHTICGAAALDPSLRDAFAKLGVELLETYGLSETTGVATLGRPGRTAAGVAGDPLPGVTLTRADDGEIRIEGPNVGRGYLGEPPRQGPLHTGDYGEPTPAGWRITGRKKELLVTLGGEKIAPAPLEVALCASPLVDQAVVVGTGRPHLAALIGLDTESVVAHLASRGRAPTGDLADDPEVVAEVQRAVDALNRTTDKARQLRAFRILPRPLSVEDGELTPTLKIRRAVVESRWASFVDAMYTRKRARLPSVERSSFTVRVARPSEHDALFALRYQVFLESGFIQPAAWPGERMRDRFDDHAVQLVLEDADGQLAGTARLIPDGPLGLAARELFTFDDLPVPESSRGEVGRLAIASRWRGRRAPVVALVRGVLDEGVRRGRTRTYAFVPARAVRAYAAFGIPVWEVPMRPPTPANLENRRRMQPYFDTQDPRVVLFTAPARD
jgi:long-chain acyl-CoA synthetase